MAPNTRVRNDIQALRALAVSMVVLFHFWPTYFPGGFAGVDVFFVISGFLISSHIFTQVEKKGRLALAEFWARRARRLLPAALFVILITVIFTFVFLPAGNKIEFAKEALASTFYAENWLLAFNSTDYFAQTTASPFQHYWSLAVEEQFYLVWPPMVALLVWFGRGRKWLSAFVVLASSMSFGYSTLLAFSNPNFAYFTPLTRVWEFGFGALIALGWAKRSREQLSKSAAWMSYLGFAGIAATVLFYNESTPFPGFAATLPVLATCLVIFAGLKTQDSALETVLKFRPIGFLGEISYSLYLWHWPLILLPAYLLNGRPSAELKVALLLLAIGLSWLTKIWVEDKVRFAPIFTKGKPRNSLLMALAISVTLAVLSGGLYLVGKSQTRSDEAAVAKLSASQTFGANWLDLPKEQKVAGTAPIMPLEQARHDGADPGASCMTMAEKPAPIICEFGSGNTSKRVLLVGDSHAGTHLGAFKALAQKHGWQLVLAYKAGCSFSLVARNDTARGITCYEWNQRLQKLLANQPAFELVITTSYVTNHLQDLKVPNWDDLAIAGFKAAWRPLIRRGATVVALRDNPEMNAAMSKCWTDSVLNASKCTQPIDGALHKDVSQIAAKQLDGAKTLDLTDLYCFDGQCPAVIGGVYVYRNSDHVGGTYDKSMTRGIEKRLSAVVPLG